MGLVGGIGRTLAIPLILLNLALAIIILGIAGRQLDRSISLGGLGPGFRGNGATSSLVLFSILAAVTAIATYLAGLHHLRVWRNESGGGAQAVSWIAWLLLIIAFCLAWKEIHIGHRGVKLRVLEAFVIILTFTHLLYTLLLHLGSRDHHNDTGTHNNKAFNPNAPTAASAV